MGSPTTTLLSQGITAGQRFYQAISQNQVNSQNPQYVSVQPRLMTTKVSSHLVGVALGSLQRCSDPLALRQLGKAKLNLGSSTVLSAYQEELQVLMGEVGSESQNLSGRIQSFFESIQSPTQAPGTSSYFENVILNARLIVEEFNRLSQGIQELRQKADHEIDTTVGRINTLLKSYFDYNKAIGYHQHHDQVAFSAEDDRDAIFLELSSYLKVTESSEKTRDGVMSAFKNLFGPDGVPLVTQNHVSQLDFSQSGLMSAHNKLEKGNLSGIRVGCDTIKQDITPLLMSGKLSGLLTLRDSILTNAQEILDEWASAFQEHINDIHNQGSSYFAPSSLLSGREIDAAFHWAGKSGNLRAARVSHRDGTTEAFVDIELETVQTLPELLKTLHDQLGILFWWEGDHPQEKQLRLTVPGEGHGLAFRGLSEDAKDLLKSLGLNDLFIGDPKRQRDSGDVTGAASDLQVNPRILKDPHEMAHGLLSDLSVLQVGDTAIQMADWRNLIALGAIDGDKWNFQAAGDFSAQALNIFDYGRLFFSRMAEKASSAQSVSRVMQTIETKWADQLHESQGVDENENRIQQLAWNEYLRTVMQLIGNTYSLDQYFLSIFAQI